LFVACTSAMVAFDITTPAAPILITSLPSVYTLGGVAIQGDNAFVLVAATNAPGYYVIDNTMTPSAFVPAGGFFLNNGSAQDTEIAIVSNNGVNYAYVSTQGTAGIEVENLASLP